MKDIFWIILIMLDRALQEENHQKEMAKENARGYSTEEVSITALNLEVVGGRGDRGGLAVGEAGTRGRGQVQGVGGK